MWQKVVWGILGGLWACSVQAREFLYPVASSRHGELYVVHQKDVNHIDLWIINQQQPNGRRGLLSHFFPAGLTLLPDESGFSCIDRGQLRIKRFNRRTPKLIDFCYPIYDVNSVHWIDSEHCYLNAKKNNHHALFYIDFPEHQIYCLQEHATRDYRFPQRVNGEIFYVEHHTHDDRPDSYAIMAIACPHYQSSITQENTEEIIRLYPAPARMVLDAGSRRILFLAMTSPESGYFVEHLPSNDTERIHLACCSFERELFRFSIPNTLVMSEDITERLHETILPFLPRYTDNTIYFCSDCERADYTIDIFAYDKATGTIIQKTAMDTGRVACAPLCLNTQVLYGTDVAGVGDVITQADIRSFAV